MKKILAIAFIFIFFSACRSKEDKKDKIVTNADTISKTATDSIPPPPPPKDSLPPTIIKADPPKSSKTSAPEKPARDPRILRNIDQHLVSTSTFTANPGGGISNATVTV